MTAAAGLLAQVWTSRPRRVPASPAPRDSGQDQQPGSGFGNRHGAGEVEAKHRHRHHGMFAAHHTPRRAVTALAIGNSQAPLPRHLADCVGQTDGAGGGGVSPALPSVRGRHPSHRARSMTTAMSSKRRLTSCPQSTSTASDPSGARHQRSRWAKAGVRARGQPDCLGHVTGGGTHRIPELGAG